MQTAKFIFNNDSTPQYHMVLCSIFILFPQFPFFVSFFAVFFHCDIMIFNILFFHTLKHRCLHIKIVHCSRSSWLEIFSSILIGWMGGAHPIRIVHDFFYLWIRLFSNYTLFDLNMFFDLRAGSYVKLMVTYFQFPEEERIKKIGKRFLICSVFWIQVERCWSVTCWCKV